MKKKRALAASRDPVPKDHIVFVTGGEHTDNELMRITPEGFYVRGQPVPQDEREAQVVYNAFKEFLVYHSIAREYS